MLAPRRCYSQLFVNETRSVLNLSSPRFLLRACAGTGQGRTSPRRGAYSWGVTPRLPEWPLLKPRVAPFGAGLGIRGQYPEFGRWPVLILSGLI